MRADCTHVRVAGKDKVVVQSIHVMGGRTLEVEVLLGEDERTIVRYVSRLAKLTGAEVLVTDDADAFKTAAVHWEGFLNDLHQRGLEGKQM